MKLRNLSLAAALALFSLAGCEETKTDVPGTAGSDISGQAPPKTGTPAQDEAGGAGGGGAFTANPTGETKPSEVPANYPRPEGVTPKNADEAKPAAGAGDAPKTDEAKPAEGGAEAPKTDAAKPAEESKA